MAIHMYHDFVLVADEVGRDGTGAVNTFAVSVFDSPVGQGEKKERVTVPQQLAQWLRWLEGRQIDKDVDRQMNLGEALAGLLLPSYARQLFSESLKRLRDGEGLRLRLRLADELANFPWEYMYIQDMRGERASSSFLALDSRISIVRHEALNVPGDWFEAPNSRRIVIAMASPQPYERYHKLESLPVEQRSLKAALSEIAGVKAVYLPEYQTDKVDAQPGATLKDVIAALMERTDIFHFSGHSEFAEERGEIILADARNQAAAIAADRFAEVLRGKGVRLVVLGACETGRRDGINVWSSVAAALLKVGIPAVVAMQFTIQDTLAAAFCSTFYRALIAGYTVDEAVALGRAVIRVESQGDLREARDWGTPVLYLRSPNGVVFNPVRDEQARHEAQQKLEHLFEQHVREVSSTGRMVGPVIGSMQQETVTVDQTVDERVSGVVIGTSIFTIQGGRLVVRQKADVVDGTMVGAVIGQLGGVASAVSPERQALDTLERALRLDRPSSVKGVVPGRDTVSPVSTTPARLAPATDAAMQTPAAVAECPNCRQPVQADAQFCQHCGAPLPVNPKFCIHCGSQVAVGSTFCAQCGTRVG